MKLTVSIQASAFSSNMEPDGVMVRVRDEASRTEVLEVRLAFEEWGKVVSGRTGEGAAELRPAAAGKIHEHKTERVPFDWSDRSEVSAMKALEPFEVDGWRGMPADLTNHHKRDGQGFQRVTFHRYVDPEVRS